MPAIGDAFVTIHANTGGFEKDLSQGVTKATKGATKEMGGLEKATARVDKTARKFIGAYLGIQGIRVVKAFVDDSIRAYSDLNESANAVTVSFGENADEVLRLGKAAAQNLGLSNAEFNQLSVSVSAFTDKIADSLGLEVPDVLDTLTTRIADFASVMNLEVADGFEKFRSGLAGESEPLRRFGIDVSAATVEQTALAAGIIATGEEMTEAQKVTARYLTIMQQTEKVAGDFANTSEDLANSTRIAAAEIENNKAKVGELLVPIKRLTTSITTLAVEGFAQLATTILGATGAMDPHLATLQNYQIQAGEGTDAATLLAGAVLKASQEFEDSSRGNERNKETTEALTAEIEGLATATDLSAEDAQNLIDKMDFLTETMGLTDEAAEILAEVLGDKVVNATLDAEHAAADTILTYQDLGGATGDLEGDMGDMEDAVDSASDALKKQQDLIRAQLDPVFALSEAVRGQADAQDEATAAADEFGLSSPQHIEALEKLSEANLDLAFAEQNVKTNTDLTRQAFIDQQVELGHTEADAERLAAKFDALNAFKFDPKVINIEALFKSSGGGGVIDKFLQHGGPLGANEVAVVGEDGPEIFIPKVAGNVISNDQITTGGVTVGSISVSLSGGATQADADMVADAIESRLQRLAKARVVR